MATKTDNARDLAEMAINIMRGKTDYTARPRHTLAASYILVHAVNGETACAAVLATMSGLFKEHESMIYSAEDRATFAAAVFTMLDHESANKCKRSRDWIKAFYWLRDGTEYDEKPSFFARVTMQGCKLKVNSGMAAAWQLCAALYGKELLFSGDQYGDGKQPDQGFREVFKRCDLLVDAITGTKAETPAPVTKPFTVWIADQVRGDAGYIERPFICHVDAVEGDQLADLALQVYRQAAGLPVEGWKEYADQNGAYAYQVIAGHVDFSLIVTNYDGISGDDSAYFWGL